MATLNQRKFRGRRLRRETCSVIAVFLYLGFLSGCSTQPIPDKETLPPAFTPIGAKTIPTTFTVTPAPLPSVTPLQTDPVNPTMTATFSATATPRTAPTYTILRGEVNQEHVMCFYGPSKAYLYKYGLLGGNRLEIIGILRDTGYLEIRAIGGNNPCWMNLQFMDVQGNLESIPTVDPLNIELPWSPYYDALGSVLATRVGENVTISWSPLELRAGDDSEQEPYLVETWVCQNGSIVFIPFGVYDTEVTVIDQPGCSQASFGRVYGVEKHGYTPYLMIQWPPHVE